MIFDTNAPEQIWHQIAVEQFQFSCFCTMCRNWISGKMQWIATNRHL